MSRKIKSISDETKKSICLRCGKCCFYRDHNGVLKKCRYLIQFRSITSCRIYNHRLNVEIDVGMYCVPRDQQKLFIKGCPLNVLLSESEKPQSQ